MNKDSAAQIIKLALKEGRSALSEHEAKQVLAAYGVSVTREYLVENRGDVEKTAKKIGYPLVMKGCSFEIAHKTEKGLIYTDIRNDAEALEAFDRIKKGLNGYSGAILIQEMVKGRRELVMGLMRDEQFGPCVMFGLGGIFTEILKDISFRRAPIDESDAVKMIREIRGNKIVDALRGMEAVDIKTLAQMLIGIGHIGLDFECV
ncbi:MAG: carboxylate--amine ligase, partial [Deltaproteobacteria bacterium RBG_19FT_COMBO_43_11]